MARSRKHRQTDLDASAALAAPAAALLPRDDVTPRPVALSRPGAPIPRAAPRTTPLPDQSAVALARGATPRPRRTTPRPAEPDASERPAADVADIGERFALAAPPHVAAGTAAGAIGELEHELARTLKVGGALFQAGIGRLGAGVGGLDVEVGQIGHQLEAQLEAGVGRIEAQLEAGVGRIEDAVEAVEFGVAHLRPLAVAWALLGAAAGAAVLLVPLDDRALAAAGWQALGPLLGIALIVCSLFGDLPRWIAWTQRLGAWLYPGLLIGTVAVLLPLLVPAAGRASSFQAFSPRVWLAYLAIVLVSLSFEQSSLPTRVYWLFQARALGPALLVPAYVLVAGLLGNVLDGVSIIAISVVIFRRLLPGRWAAEASFALLFGGLLSNFLTVAAEPTNIKFQDALAPLLDRVQPSYWLTNWPISLLAIVLPVAVLGARMARGRATWLSEESAGDGPIEEEVPRHAGEPWLGFVAILLLAAGIVAHSALQFRLDALGRGQEPPPLGLFLLPAGLAALLHLRLVGSLRQRTHRVHFALPFRRKVVVHHSKLPATWKHVKFEVPVWIKLAVIFSLLWYLANGLAAGANVFGTFFTWAEPLRFGAMSVLSLASSVTDNVALAAMQGSLLINHPMAVWQIRFLFILLTWAGGYTPFGCLQSLALNSRLRLSTGAWFRAGLLWSGLAIVGALAGLALIGVLYPGAVGPVR